ncbi:hypothetical protein [Nocardia sp. SC052]|uniref:hypothetical protein n=1 Tax=Nocardia sichangensis TaxID=3385975 RepID=UPI0039A2646A
MSAPGPSVGRVVHFQDHEYAPPSAAIVAHVNEDGSTLNLTVCDMLGGTRGILNIPFAEEPTVGHWNWPPRV